MLPKPLYELLPGLYTVAGVVTLLMNDSALRFFPAILLFSATALVIYMRYEFRHLPPKERARRMAQKYQEKRAH